MTSRELQRRLRRLGATFDRSRGRGAHVMVELRGKRTVLPTYSGDMPSGTVRAVLRQLGLNERDLATE